MELRVRANTLVRISQALAGDTLHTLRVSMLAKRHMTEPKLRFRTNRSRGNYYVGKQQSIQWIRGARHREGEKVLQRNAGVKDFRDPWLAQIASVRRE